MGLGFAFLCNHKHDVAGYISELLSVHSSRTRLRKMKIMQCDHGERYVYCMVEMGATEQDRYCRTIEVNDLGSHYPSIIGQ